MRFLRRASSTPAPAPQYDGVARWEACSAPVSTAGGELRLRRCRGGRKSATPAGPAVAEALNRPDTAQLHLLANRRVMDMPVLVRAEDDGAELVVHVPSGAGSANEAWLNGGRDRVGFAYAQPTLSRIGVAPPGGGELRIFGENLGACAADVAVYVRGERCSSVTVAVPHTELRCVVGAGFGDDIAVAVAVYDQIARGYCTQRGESISIDDVAEGGGAGGAACALAGAPPLAARVAPAAQTSAPLVGLVGGEVANADADGAPAPAPGAEAPTSAPVTERAALRCTECAAKFGSFTRRHACQFCASQFCAACTCLVGAPALRICVTCRAQQHAQHVVARFFDELDDAQGALRAEELAALQSAFVHTLDSVA